MGPFNFTKASIHKKIEKNLRELASSDNRKEIETHSIKTLQEELLEDFSYSIMNDHRLIRESNLISNFNYNILTGELEDVKIDTIEIESKHYTNEAKHHDVAGKSIKIGKSNKVEKRKNMLNVDENFSQDQIKNLGEKFVSRLDAENSLTTSSNKLLQEADFLLSELNMTNNALEEIKPTGYKIENSYLIPKDNNDLGKYEHYIVKDFLEFLPKINNKNQVEEEEENEDIEEDEFVDDTEDSDKILPKEVDKKDILDNELKSYEFKLITLAPKVEENKIEPGNYVNK